MLTLTSPPAACGSSGPATAWQRLRRRAWWRCAVLWLAGQGLSGQLHSRPGVGWLMPAVHSDFCAAGSCGLNL